MEEKLNTLVKLLQDLGCEAELGELLVDRSNPPERNDYLIRYNLQLPDDAEDEGENPNPLVLMGDLGVTWESLRAYSTVRYCTVTLDDLPKTAEKLWKIAKAREAGTLKDEDGSAENL